MKKHDEVIHDEEQALRWPEGQPRTRIQDREGRSAWKQPMGKVKEMLRRELELSGATSSLLTYSIGPLDPGAAIYFSRKAVNQYAWQEALGMIGKVPSREEIQKAYHALVKPIHTDNPGGGDAALFRALTDHRDRALDFIAGKHRHDHEYAFGIDVFEEVRLNINAIKVVLFSLRRIEDCGSPLMLERAYRGFQKQIAAGQEVA